MKRTIVFFVSILALNILSPFFNNVWAQGQAAAGQQTPDSWPRFATIGGTKYTMYQPQLDSWDGYFLRAKAAVSVQLNGVKEPIFGVLEFSAKTMVDRTARTVFLNDFTVHKLVMPSAQGAGTMYEKGFLAFAPAQGRVMSLDRLEAMLAIDGAEKIARRTPVRNDPPAFIFSPSPAVLVPVDGEPFWQPLPDSSLVRAINSRAFVARDTVTGTCYIHLFDGFVTAPSLTGPWTSARSVPSSVTKAAMQLGQQKIVDLMAGQPDEKTKKKPSLKQGAPQVVVTMSPTELIVTDGSPQWLPVEKTSLLYVKNTTGNIFKSTLDQQTYVLVAGRWFRAPGFGGPWQYVDGPNLPQDFARIPDDSPKENVKASVPGTPQAQEAAIAASIPQTATIDRSKARFKPVCNGAPELKLIPDTALMYVVNSPHPIIMVHPDEWYATQDGIWYTAKSVQDPWIVATSIPAAIYAIPPSSPIHYVTYVKIYDVTPKYVVVGYTPGYMGTIVTSSGVVVYGTGYVYAPYVVTTVWYPAPVTYGYAATVTYTPWTGWAVGFGFGWAMGVHYACAPAPYWGPMPYARYGAVYAPGHGAVAWGPGGWAATTGNVYQRSGSTGAVTRTSGGYNAWTGNAWSNKVGTSYNSTTGRISAGQKASVSNAYTGNYAYGQRGATYNPNTGVSAKGGSITYGNANNGTQNTIKGAQITGPGGESKTVVKSGDNYYAGHDGNAYKYDSQSGTAQKYENGSWNTVEKPSSAPGAKPTATSGTPTAKQTTPQDLQAQQAARQKGDTRSAASYNGSKSWGGGFNSSGSNAGTGARPHGTATATNGMSSRGTGSGGSQGATRNGGRRR